MFKKRLFSILVCLVVMCSSAFIVYAAPAAQLNEDINSVKRGDTVNFVISVSDTDATKSVGALVKYDETVFEFVSGEILVSGAMLSDFSDSVAVAAFLSATNVNGEIASFKLKVKDNASFGEYDIGINVSFGNTLTLNASSTLTVYCEHEYGESEQHSETQHKQTCECGDVKYSDHTWNAGEIVTPATHTTVGEKKYTCTECGATKVKEIAKTTAHAYGESEQHSETQHKRTCECGDVKYSDHTWNAGEIVTPATHTTVGEKKYTCTECGFTKSEEIAKTTAHAYGESEQHSETQHKQTCECGDVKYSDHTWNAGEIVIPATHTTVGEKKYTCTECGFTKSEEIAKTSAHTYGESEQHSETQHKQTCECGDVKYSDHTWNAGEIVTPATHTTVGEKKYACTECGATKVVEIPVIEEDKPEDNPATSDAFAIMYMMMALICVITTVKKLKKTRD